MHKLAALAALSIALTTSAVSAQAIVRNAPKPPTASNAQWYIAPDGCSYSRTQAPGYPVVWMLIKNPHHIGGQNATKRCKSML